jgi:hypothetical protein
MAADLLAGASSGVNIWRSILYRAGRQGPSRAVFFQRSAASSGLFGRVIHVPPTRGRIALAFWCLTQSLYLPTPRPNSARRFFRRTQPSRGFYVAVARSASTMASSGLGCHFEMLSRRIFSNRSPQLGRRDAGRHSDRLDESKPADLKTAKALGLTIPPQLLARADEVIE